MSLPEHLYIRPLTVYDVDQCVALEEDGFPPNERCSPDKLKYRLSVCPELCSGLFIRNFEISSKEDQDHDDDDDYYHNSKFVDEKLIGQIVATKIFDQRITERSMGIPKFAHKYIVDESILDNDKIGHVELSSNIGIHSLIIHSDYKKLGLGTLILKDYIQKLNQQEIGDKIIIIAHQLLIPFYKRIGFVDQGESDCKYAGETWNDLVLPLVKDDQDD